MTSYSAAIRADEKGAAWEEALWTLSELRQWHTSDVISYSSVINARGAGEKWRLAPWLMEDMPGESSLAKCDELQSGHPR